ncbi:unnamed protein product [Amoebophrya sp. A25]|nr:unnamed protein product [Amoebophrya sp. A25]|eukprot:GSA25T00017530001.1
MVSPDGHAEEHPPQEVEGDEDTYVVPDEEEDEEQLRAELERLEAEAGGDLDMELDFLDEEEMQIGGDDDEEGEDVEDHAAFTFRGHTDAVLHCCFIDEAAMLTCGQDDSVHRWSVEALAGTGTSCSSSNSPSSTCAGTPSEKGDDTTEKAEDQLQKTSVSTRYALKSAASNKAHKDSVVGVLLNHDKSLVATLGYDGVANICDMKELSGTKEELLVARTLEGPGAEIEFGAWHPKGNVFLAGSGDSTSWMWHAGTGQCMNVYAGHSDAVTCGGFLNNGKSIATGSRDGTVIVFNPKEGRAVEKLLFDSSAVGGDGSEITCLADTNNLPIGDSNGNVFAVGTASGEVFLCNFDFATSSGKVTSKMSPAHDDAVEVVAFQTKLGGDWQKEIGLFMASAGLDGRVRLWNLRTGSLRYDLLAHDGGGVTCLKWADSAHGFGAYFVTGSLDWTAKLWSAQSGQCLQQFSGHSDAILSLDILHPHLTRPHELLILSASDDATAKLWEWSSPKKKAAIAAEKNVAAGEEA